MCLPVNLIIIRLIPKFTAYLWLLADFGEMKSLAEEVS